MSTGINLQRGVRIQVYKEAEYRCEACGKEAANDDPLTIDHILPKSLMASLGFMDYNHRENLQCLCRQCNNDKGSLLDPRNKKTARLLKKAFDRWKRLHVPERKQNVYVFKNLKVKCVCNH